MGASVKPFTRTPRPARNQKSSISPASIDV
jgi:hypothetical protein